MKLGLGIVSIVIIAMLVIGADWWVARPMDEPRQFVGRKTCAECHRQEAEAWAGSDHDLAMDLATPETVLGDFNDREFTHFGVTSRMHRDGDAYVMTTDGPDGRMQDFKVKYTFGVHPLQQYLVEFDDGRVQCLPVSWDTDQQRWFHLYPDEEIDSEDILHWTKPAQNWNHMCAECHSTNVHKNYDLKTNTFHTTFSEIDVSCEACHGPGSLHVELATAKSLFWDRRHGYGLAKLKDTSSKAQLDTCATCHSRRRNVYAGFHGGDELLDFYEPEILDGAMYHVDGQILEEDYVYGSFLQSLMYRKGVRCTDCHDPHTARLKAEGNQLCNRCHQPAKYDTPLHYHHKASSTGAACVECHMPERTYMVVDPRRDHSIRVPRPDISVALNTPNACNRCHDDHNAQWAADHVVNWYGEKRRDTPHYAQAIDAGRKGLSEGESLLQPWARRRSDSPMVRASAVSLLGQYDGQESIDTIHRALDDPNALVRAAAVRQIERYSDAEVARLLVPLVNDPIRLVRTEAARILTRVHNVPLEEEQRDAYRSALKEYVEGQLSMADQAAAHHNLGVIYTNLGKIDQAERSYRTALRIEPRFIESRYYLAVVLNEQGRTKEAERLLRETIAETPDFVDAHYALGLLLAAAPDKMEEAAQALKQVVQLDPESAPAWYNLGLAQQNMGQLESAEISLQRACLIAPDVARYQRAIVILLAQMERWSAAVRASERLLVLGGPSPERHVEDQRRHRYLLQHSTSKRPFIGPPTID